MNYLKIANALIKAYELDVEPDDLAAYIKKIDVGVAKAKRPAAEVEAEAEEGAIEYSEPDENHVVTTKTPQTCVRIVTPKGGASAPCGAKAIRGLVKDDGEVEWCCGTVASGHLAATIRDSKKESAKAGPAAKVAKAAPGGGVKKLVAKNLGVYVEERERVTEVPGTKYFKDSTGLLFVKTHDSYEVVGVLTKQGGKVVPGKITVEARKSIQRRNLPVAASATYVTLDGEDDDPEEEAGEDLEEEEPKPKAKAPKAKAPKAKAPPEDEEEDLEEEEPKPKAKAKAVPKARAPKVKAPPPEDEEVVDAEDLEEEEPKPKAKAPKAKAPKVKAPPPEDEEVEDAEEPKPKAKAPKAKAAKAPKAKVPPPEDEVDDEEEEVPPPKAKAPKAKAPKAKAKAPPADEDEEEEVEEPKPKAKAKAVPKKAFIDVVEEDEGEAYDGEEDDEEDEE